MENNRNKQKKLITAVATAFIITASATPLLSEKGVIGGYGDGIFKPDNLLLPSAQFPQFCSAGTEYPVPWPPSARPSFSYYESPDNSSAFSLTLPSSSFLYVQHPHLLFQQFHEFFYFQ